MIQYECRRCGEPMESPDSLAGQEDTCPKCGCDTGVPNGQTGGKALRYTLGAAGCTAAIIAYSFVGVLLGWQHGGGALPILCLLSLCGVIWYGVTQRKAIAKRHATTFAGTLLLFVVILAAAAIFWPQSGVSTETSESDTDNETAVQLPLPWAELHEGWQRVEIPDVGTIDIPPCLEVQSGPVAQLGQALKSEMGLETDRKGIIIQQAGMNQLDSGAANRYVRIIVRTQRFAPGEVESLREGLALSAAEQDEVTAMLEAQLRPIIPIVRFGRVRIVKIAGMDALRIGYVRNSTSGDGHIHVEQYTFPNHDRSHEVTIAYRLSEREQWARCCSDVLHSFRITNIRGSQ